MAQSKTVQTRPNQKPKKGKKAENPTEGVVMRRHKPSDQVFSHRTSKVEEYAIVSQRRTSTNDEEVAVKFEVCTHSIKFGPLVAYYTCVHFKF